MMPLHLGIKAETRVSGAAMMTLGGVQDFKTRLSQESEEKVVDAQASSLASLSHTRKPSGLS
jgi:hypothetical protein